MPALRAVRRSRRLSNKPPRDPVFEDPDEFDQHDLQTGGPREPASQAPEVCPTCKDPPLPGALLPKFACPEVGFDFVRRSSHSRKRGVGHIPRPPNAFMLFRSELWAKEKIKSSVERDHRMISRIAGKRWNELSESERTPFRLLAEAAKRQHAELYPDYKYSPVFKKEKLPRRKGAKGGDRDWARCNVVAGLLGDGYEGEELEKRMKSYDRKEMMYELASRRPRARAIQARKTRVVQREASPDTRSPSPAALPEDGLIKMEPSTPELSFSPEPVPQEPDVPEAVHPSYLLPPPPNINADEKKPFDRESSTGSSVGDEVGDEVASDRHWPDKSPAVLDLSVGANGQTYVQSPSQGLMIPVTLCAYPDDPFGEAVDDAFSISPMFNPDRSSALVGPKPSMLNIGSCSQADDVKAEDEFDFSEWLVSAH